MLKYLFLILGIIASIYWIWYVEHDDGIIAFGVPALAMTLILSEFDFSSLKGKK